jgi:hypothetical protein
MLLLISAELLPEIVTIALIIAKNDGERRLIRGIIGDTGRLSRNRLGALTRLWRTECRYDSPSGRARSSESPVHNKANFESSKTDDRNRRL